MSTMTLRQFAAADRPAAEDANRSLAQRELLVVERPLGRTVVCRGGCLWLTFDGCSADFVIEAGQAHCCAHPGRLVIQAMRTSALSLA